MLKRATQLFNGVEQGGNGKVRLADGQGYQPVVVAYGLYPG